MVANYTEGDEPVPGFRLLRLLGWGRFGEVWKATAPGGFEAAVKLISLSSAHGIKEYRAIRLFKQIRHPNLVPLMALWLKDKQGNFIDEEVIDDGTPLQAQAAELIIAMGVGDKSLFDRLKECREDGLPGIPGDELLGYMEQVAGALDFLNQPCHDLGAGQVAIQHCDIKPHNLLIVGRAAQICDLGVARVMQDPRATSAMGSAAYIAPECIQQGRPSSATDQYSLAISYVEMRTGSLPFEAKTVAAAYMVHMQGRLDLSRLSAAEQAVIRRATTVEAEARYPSIRAMVQDLRRAMSDEPEAMASTPLPVSSETTWTDPVAAVGVSRQADRMAWALDQTDAPPPRRIRVTSRVPASSVLAAGETDPDIAPPPLQETPPPSIQRKCESRFDPMESLPSLFIGAEPLPGTPPLLEPPTPWQIDTSPRKPARMRAARIVLACSVALPLLALAARLLSSTPVAATLGESSQITDDMAPTGEDSPAESRRPSEVVTPVRTQDATDLLKVARKHLVQSEYQLAEAGFSELLQQPIQLPEAFTGRATARIELGKCEEAIADATAALKLRPRDAAALEVRAVARLRSGSIHAAIEDCNAAIGINSRFGAAYFTRGCAYAQKQAFDRAVADFNQAIQLEPTSTRAWHERTHAYMAQGLGRLDRAITEYTADLGKDPKNVHALTERAHAHLHRGRLEPAITDSTAALRLIPGFAEALSVRGEAYRQKGKTEQAIQDCTEAVRNDSRCMSAYLSRGVAYLDLGNAYDQAIADFDRVLLINPQFREAYLKRGEAYAIKGKYDRSREDYERGRQDGRSMP